MAHSQYQKTKLVLYIRVLASQCALQAPKIVGKKDFTLALAAAHFRSRDHQHITSGKRLRGQVGSENVNFCCYSNVFMLTYWVRGVRKSSTKKCWRNMWMASKEKRRNKCVTEQQVMDLICGHNGHSQNAKDFGCSYFFLALKKESIPNDS